MICASRGNTKHITNTHRRTVAISDISEISQREKTAAFPENQRENQKNQTKPQRRAAQLTCRTFRKFRYEKKAADSGTKIFLGSRWYYCWIRCGYRVLIQLLEVGISETLAANPNPPGPSQPIPPHPREKWFSRLQIPNERLQTKAPKRKLPSWNSQRKIPTLKFPS